MHKTTATPLAWIYASLVLYASLYPFSDWRDQGIGWAAFMWAPPARYWTGFDVTVNVLGYLPLGGLLALSAVRSGRGRFALALAVALPSMLSFVTESLQSYLPARVASREDWLLNTAGAFLGAACTLMLERWGAISRWNRFRRRWFVEHSRGAIVLLATWPVALLFPPAVPFGLGQVYERVEQALLEALSDTSLLAWVPVREFELEPLVPVTELACVWLGLLVPCLLGFCVVRTLGRRLLLVPIVLLVGFLLSGLSAALSWGPLHAWAWLDLPAQLGIAFALPTALALAFMRPRAYPALILLSLGVLLSVLNQAPESPYFAQTLHEWEQGRFIRFNGLAQWVGWLWPYAVIVYTVGLAGQRDVKN